MTFGAALVDVGGEGEMAHGSDDASHCVGETLHEKTIEVVVNGIGDDVATPVHASTVLQNGRASRQERHDDDGICHGDAATPVFVLSTSFCATACLVDLVPAVCGRSHGGNPAGDVLSCSLSCCAVIGEKVDGYLEVNTFGAYVWRMGCLGVYVQLQLQRELH